MAHLALLGLALGASIYWFGGGDGDGEDVQVGGHTYRVLRDSPERMKEVATQLGGLRAALQEFIAGHCVASPADESLARVAALWDGSLRETGRGAYTADKSSIALCVRHPRTGALQPWDTCAFVALHELAHIATERVGHTEAFWENFAKLVALARADELLDPAGVGACYCGAPVGAVPGGSA